MNNQLKTTYKFTPNGTWAVKGNIAVHSSGLIASTQINTTKNHDVKTKSILPKDWVKNHGLDFQVLLNELCELEKKGIITYDPKSFSPIEYEIPKKISHQYKGEGLVIATIYESELKAIIYLRDVLSEKEYQDYTCPEKQDADYDESETINKLKIARKSLEAFGDVRSGYCDQGHFFDVDTPVRLKHQSDQ